MENAEKPAPFIKRPRYAHDNERVRPRFVCSLLFAEIYGGCSLIAKIVGEVSLAFMHGNGRQNSRLLKDFS